MLTNTAAVDTNSNDLVEMSITLGDVDASNEISPIKSSGGQRQSGGSDIIRMPWVQQQTELLPSSGFFAVELDPLTA